MKFRYQRLMNIEQVLSKLERCVPMGLRKEINVSEALSDVGHLIEDCMEADMKAGKHIIPSYADGRYQELEVEYNAMQQAIDDDDELSNE